MYWKVKSVNTAIVNENRGQLWQLDKKLWLLPWNKSILRSLRKAWKVWKLCEKKAAPLLVWRRGRNQSCTSGGECDMYISTPLKDDDTKRSNNCKIYEHYSNLVINAKATSAIRHHWKLRSANWKNIQSIEIGTFVVMIYSKKEQL